MNTRLRTTLFALFAVTFGVLAFGIEPFDESVLIDALFLVSALGFIASAVSELIAIATTLSNENRSEHAMRREPIDRQDS